MLKKILLPFEKDYLSCVPINQKLYSMRKVTFILLFLWITAMSAFAGGYQVGLHSARNIGMGLIGTSLNYDASCLFYNPGGAPFINEKWSFSGGVTFIMSRTTFQATGEVYQEHAGHELNTPFYGYAAFKPTKDLSVGIAVNTPYGLSLSWPDEWKGKFLIQNISFHAITIQPTVSYKFKDIIGIGVGFVISTGNVDLNRAIPVTFSDTMTGTTKIKGNATNFGFNAGIMVHPIKGLNIGVDYRSKIDMKVTGGDATFSVPPSLASNFPASKADVTLPLPANLDFGASYQINDKWMVGMSLNYVFWNVYDSLVFKFTQDPPLASGTTTSVPSTSATAKLYKNRLITRIGAQFKINEKITVRAGGYYDPSPVPTDYLDPMLPSSNEIGLTCGLSWFPVKGLSVDASFEYLMGQERTGQSSPNVNPGDHNFAGTYSTAFYMPGIGLTYNF
jgi:long-chain fatty acid transport protein